MIIIKMHNNTQKNIAIFGLTDHFEESSRQQTSFVKGTLTCWMNCGDRSPSWTNADGELNEKMRESDSWEAIGIWDMRDQMTISRVFKL